MTVYTHASTDEREVLAALRSGDERAFASLVERYHGSFVRVAQNFVRDRAVAEEVAQDAWLGVIRGIARFRGESSLKTWIFKILTNRAKDRAVRERRTVSLTELDFEDAGPSVHPSRFLDDGHPLWPGHWSSAPASWVDVPEERLLAGETMARVEAAIETLPPVQRQVITLRDVEGWSSEEVRALLDLSEANQRVLLHRARSKVRAALEAYFEGDV
jgi:RNA polymerase sigma-70 factor (ECF subfamily)